MQCILKTFLNKKEELIKDLKEKLSISVKKLAHSTLAFNKMMTMSKNLNEIFKNLKTFGEKCVINYDEWIYISIMGTTKFVKFINQEPKLKHATTDPRGKYVVFPQLAFFSKLNPSPKASTSHQSSDGLLPLCIIMSTCHHCVELRHLRPHCRKLTFYSSMKVNMNTSSFSPPCSTP